MLKDKKVNEFKALGDACPLGRDVGIFGKANKFIDRFAGGMIYAAAINDLVAQTIEIEKMLATMSEDEIELMPTLQEDLAAIEMQWLMTGAIYNFEA
jgi:hypothetical protein